MLTEYTWLSFSLGDRLRSFRGRLGSVSPRSKLLLIAKAEGEAEIQPNSITDNFRRKAETSVFESGDSCFYEAILAYCSVPFPS